MKTTKDMELIEVEFWTCKNPSHRHRTEAVAQNCIDKEERIGKNPPKRWSRAELSSILERKENGTRISEIAREIGCSRSNVDRLIRKAERIRNAEKYRAQQAAMVG